MFAPHPTAQIRASSRGRGRLLLHCRELDVLAPPGRGGCSGTLRLRGREQLLLQLLLLRQGQHGLDARQVYAAAARHDGDDGRLDLVRVRVRVRLGLGLGLGIGLRLGLGIRLGLRLGLGVGLDEGRLDLACEQR